MMDLHVRRYTRIFYPEIESEICVVRMYITVGAYIISAIVHLYI